MQERQPDHNANYLSELWSIASNFVVRDKRLAGPPSGNLFNFIAVDCLTGFRLAVASAGRLKFTPARGTELHALIAKTEFINEKALSKWHYNLTRINSLAFSTLVKQLFNRSNKWTIRKIG